MTVGQLTAVVRGALSVRPELEDVLVEGEVSNLRAPGSGHLYFTLKDPEASVRCVAFRSAMARIRFMPENGMRVVLRGRVDVYPQDGTYQLYVERIDPVGVGAMAVAVDQLRRRLIDEGVIDPIRRRRLPVLPRRVAIVTSSTGAAVRDVVTVLRRRAPGVAAILIPTPVQGEGAEASVVRALRTAAERPHVEVILLVRGGGSLEDLAAFNGEQLARAIAACAVPVVTGIGHETDTTIADMVADHRAATPSAAAEVAVPDVRVLRSDVGQRASRVAAAVRGDLTRRREDLRRQGARLSVQSPSHRLPHQRQHLDSRVGALRAALKLGGEQRRRDIDARRARLGTASPLTRVSLEREGLRRRNDGLRRTIAAIAAARRAELSRHAARLHALSPLRVLDRGYSITSGPDGVIVDAAAVAPGAVLRTRLARGEIRSRTE